MRKVKVGTHDGRLHHEELRAIATLAIYLLKKYNTEIEIIRTRNIEELEQCDFVIDVGGKFDNEKYFDHHQAIGVGSRPNSKTPYSSYGLIWRRFGMELCSSHEVFTYIDKKIVEPIDAFDTGTNIIEFKDGLMGAYSMHSSIACFNPLINETDEDIYNHFIYLFEFLKNVIKREIAHAEQMINVESAKIVACIQRSVRKDIIILDGAYQFKVFQQIIKKEKGARFVVLKSRKQWRVYGVQNNLFKPIIPFPETWAGKEHEPFVSVTGVKDAIFCHPQKFLAAAGSQEGAVKLAELAIAA